jgi:hypothetical protein
MTTTPTRIVANMVRNGHWRSGNTAKETPVPNTRLFGLAEIQNVLPAARPDDYWTWCRAHEQPVKAGVKCKCLGDCPLERGEHAPDTPCVRIGPFMSDREANRLGEHPRYYQHPLGMEVQS